MLGIGRSRTAWSVLALAALLAATALAPAATAKKPGKHAPWLEFRGQLILPTGTTFQGTNVGGLSSIAYAGGETFYALSDDQANARFYRLRAAIADGRLGAGDVTIESVTTLRPARAACASTSASSRRLSVASGSTPPPRPRSSRTALPRPSRTEARLACSSTTCGETRSSGSGRTWSTRSR